MAISYIAPFPTDRIQPQSIGGLPLSNWEKGPEHFNRIVMETQNWINQNYAGLTAKDFDNLKLMMNDLRAANSELIRSNYRPEVNDYSNPDYDLQKWAVAQQAADNIKEYINIISQDPQRSANMQASLQHEVDVKIPGKPQEGLSVKNYAEYSDYAYKLVNTYNGWKAQQQERMQLGARSNPALLNPDIFNLGYELLQTTNVIANFTKGGPSVYNEKFLGLLSQMENVLKNSNNSELSLK